MKEEHKDHDSEADDFAALHIWQFQAVRDLVLIGAILLIFWIGYAMQAITVPLLIALGLAYLFEPLIDWLGKKWRVPRRWAVSSILLIFIVLGVLVVVPATMLVVSQTSDLISNVRSGKYAGALQKAVSLLPDEYQSKANSARDWVEDTAPWTRDIFGFSDASIADSESVKSDVKVATEKPEKTTPGVEDEVKGQAKLPADSSKPVTTAQASTSIQPSDEETIRRIAREEFAQLSSENSKSKDPASIAMKALGFVKSGASQVGGIILQTVELGLLLFLVPFYFFFFSASYPKVLRFGRQLIPDHNRDRAFFLIGEMNRAVSGFVRGRLVISAILGVILSVGWLIVGVPYSIVLGLVVGIFCAVPYLSIVGLPVAIGLLAVDQFALQPDMRMAWWAIILWPGLVYMVAQTLDDWVLTPLIQGKSTNLDPVSIIVAILAGGSIAGIYGMLLAVPAAACIKILLKEVLMPRIHDWTEGRASDPLPGGD